MPNIKFNYLYRDAGNYKNFGSVVFINIREIELVDVLYAVNSKLIEREFLDAVKWQLPDLHFEKWNRELDHELHEFISMELTEDVASISTDIGDWLQVVKDITDQH